MKRHITRLRESTLARNTFWMFMGQGQRLVIQAGYFVVIARSLGTRNYGAFVGVAALVNILAPFAGLGFGNLLIKNVARDRSVFSEYWGNALLMVCVSGCVLMAVVAGVAHLALPNSTPVALILLVGASDLLAARVTDIAGQAFQAFEHLRWTANLNVLLSTLRLGGAVVLGVLWRHPSALEWGVFYFGSSLITALAAIIAVEAQLGRPCIALGRIRPELAEGLYFSAGLSAQTIYNDIDKTMLARLSTLEATGIYAAAYRLIEVSFMPVRSLLYAAYPGFFRAGEGGLGNSLRCTKRLLPKAVLYAIAACCALLAFAPIVPHVVGAEYALTVEALRWLAPLPVLKTIHYFFADALTGAGYQSLRTFMQALIAGFNVVINFWLIPAYGWRGAAWSSIASDGLLLLSLLLALSLQRVFRETRVPFSVGQNTL